MDCDPAEFTTAFVDGSNYTDFNRLQHWSSEDSHLCQQMYSNARQAGTSSGSSQPTIRQRRLVRGSSPCSNPDTCNMTLATSLYGQADLSFDRTQSSGGGLGEHEADVEEPWLDANQCQGACLSAADSATRPLEMLTPDQSLRELFSPDQSLRYVFSPDLPLEILTPDQSLRQMFSPDRSLRKIFTSDQSSRQMFALDEQYTVPPFKLSQFDQYSTLPASGSPRVPDTAAPQQPGHQPVIREQNSQTLNSFEHVFDESPNAEDALTARLARTDKGKSSYTCLLCSRRLADRKGALRHFASKHSLRTPQMFCEGCGRRFKRADHLSRHVKTVHNGYSLDKSKLK